MPKTVAFKDKIVAEAKAIAPNFEFPLFAQTAVREKLDRARKHKPKGGDE